MKLGNILLISGCVIGLSLLVCSLPQKNSEVEFYDLELDAFDISNENDSYTTVKPPTTQTDSNATIIPTTLTDSNATIIPTTQTDATIIPTTQTDATIIPTTQIESNETVTTPTHSVVVTTKYSPPIVITITITFSKKQDDIEVFKDLFRVTISQILNSMSSFAYDDLNLVPVQGITEDDIVIEDVKEDGAKYIVKFYIRDSSGQSVDEEKLKEYSEEINKNTDAIKKNMNAEEVGKASVDVVNPTEAPSNVNVVLIVVGVLVGLLVVAVVIIAIIYYKKKKAASNTANYTTTYSSLGQTRKSEMIASRPISQAYSNPAYDRSTTALDSSGSNF